MRAGLERDFAHPSLTETINTREQVMNCYDLYDDSNFHECQQVMMDGFADVDCTKCGDGARVEPDGDYPCHSADCDGRLVSPLILAGLI
tara:strand:- start:27 stop:293 length:267 start_codon:yes stop_codon:yes gene_type:complete